MSEPVFELLMLIFLSALWISHVRDQRQFKKTMREFDTERDAAIAAYEASKRHGKN